MTKDFQRLWDYVANETNEIKAVRALAEILIEKEGRDFVLHLDLEDAEHCLDILGRAIAGHHLKTSEKQASFVTLRRLAGAHGRLPDSMVIAESIELEDKILPSGGFADVRVGKYGGYLVAVKTMRAAAETDDLRKIRKQFCKEVVLWSSLFHPNILKLAGVQGDLGKGEFVTVSEWMKHGNIMDYIKKNDANRLELLHGAAQGMRYLHDVGFAHGGLKGANILMSNDEPPRACLAEFGLMTMVLDPQKPMSCSTQLEEGTLRFMAPELLMPTVFGLKNPIPTPKADVYAFGLVIFQVLTGHVPFFGIRKAELGFCVVQGLRPDKPANASTIGFSDSLWDFVQLCWDGDMDSRPTSARVIEELTRAVLDGQWPIPREQAVDSETPEMPDDLREAQHLAYNFQPPPSVLPPPKRKPFQSIRARFRKMLNLFR